MGVRSRSPDPFDPEVVFTHGLLPELAMASLARPKELVDWLEKYRTDV